MEVTGVLERKQYLEPQAGICLGKWGCNTTEGVCLRPRPSTGKYIKVVMRSFSSLRSGFIRHSRVPQNGLQIAVQALPPMLCIAPQTGGRFRIEIANADLGHVDAIKSEGTMLPLQAATVNYSVRLLQKQKKAATRLQPKMHISGSW